MKEKNRDKYLIKLGLTLLNTFFFSLALVINFASSTGFLNGNTVKSISDRYHNLFTPAGYAFSIWGLIYLLLLGFIIYSFAILKREKESQIILQVGYWFVLTCLANSIWIMMWTFDYVGVSVLFMLVLLGGLIKIIVNTKMELTHPPFRVVAMVWWPFSLYSGWISVALIANISAFLTKIGWSGWGISDMNWSIIMLIIAGVLYLFMTWKRNMREFALVGVWAIIAVSLANQNHPQIYITGFVVAGIIGASSLLHAVKNFRGFGQTI